MDFQIGEKVIHWTYGLGEIARIEEKTIHGRLENCYVFASTDMMVWIPVNNGEKSTLRRPTPPEEFDKLFAILSGPCEKLADDPVTRKNQLMELIRDGRLHTIGQVVRDLTHLKRTSKLNDQEKIMLERTMNSLLNEWTFSLGVSLAQAQQDMTRMLEA